MENVESTVEDIARMSKKSGEIPENPSSKSGNETGRAGELSRKAVSEIPKKEPQKDKKVTPENEKSEAKKRRSGYIR